MNQTFYGFDSLLLSAPKRLSGRLVAHAPMHTRGPLCRAKARCSSLWQSTRYTIGPARPLGLLLSRRALLGCSVHTRAARQHC